MCVTNLSGYSIKSLLKLATAFPGAKLMHSLPPNLANLLSTASQPAK